MIRVAILQIVLLALSFNSSAQLIAEFLNNKPVEKADLAAADIDKEYIILINRGNAMLENGNYADAANFFGLAISLQPEEAVAYDKRAIAYMQQKKFHKAAKDLISAIETDSLFADAYLHLGIIHDHYESYDLAIVSYTRAIEIDKQFAKAYYNRSLTFLKINDVTSAFNDLKTASKLHHEIAENIIWEHCTDVLLVVNE
ncbi:MAG: tetratricopeptide repeat protein [Bacteroidales bacterium]|nr:tetratricopeptide repeat protein [Bacteroidales bacterium]